MTKKEIINYIMTTPSNTNWSVLKSILGEGNWEKLREYVQNTPYNMNRKVLESFFDIDNKARIAVVGTAIVCRDIVG